MKKLKSIFYNTFLFTALSFVLISCYEEECIDPIDTFATTALNSSISSESLKIDSLSIKYISNENAELDSVFVTPFAANSSEIYILLDPNSEITTFELHADTTDYVTIYHENELKFISSDCGFAPVHKITAIEFTKNRIDTIIINNITVSPDDVQNFTISLTPITTESVE